MTQAYFDRTAAMFLTTEASFDAYPVEVPAEIVLFTEMVNDLVASLHLEAEQQGAPEDSAQILADKFVAGMEQIAKELS